MLSNESGFSLCRRLRATSSVLIIMVITMDDAIDRSVGLETEVDGYLVKPMNARGAVGGLTCWRRSAVI